VNLRRLFVLILLAQTTSVAVGLSFHHLYVSSALVQAEEDEARGELTRKFGILTSDSGQRDLSSLQQDRQFWQSTLARWQTTATPADHLYLLDQQGRVAAGSDDRATGSTGNAPGHPLEMLRASAPWGRFDEPIRGLLKRATGNGQVAIAQGLSSHDGYLLLTRDIANDEATAKAQAALWAATCITLPWVLVLQAVTLFMIVTHFKQGQSRDQARPEVEALKQAQALVRTQETVIFGLAKLSDSRDADTGSHLERIAHYSSALAAGLRQRPEFREQVTPSFVQRIGVSSALHDIGKVGVEDSILRKPGALTFEERTQMQSHTRIGEECLKEIERRLGSSNFLQMAREISSAHHERWDGKGYPMGLSGEQIPLSARIVAIADVYDALSCKRVYKEALPHPECVATIAKAAGTHFDPRVVEVFLEIEDRFRQISQQFQTAAASKTEAMNTATPLLIPEPAILSLTDSDFAAT
jgi:response regulator RpfG family c-di-GMP phosphodiesterase